MNISGINVQIYPKRLITGGTPPPPVPDNSIYLDNVLDPSTFQPLSPFTDGQETYLSRVSPGSIFRVENTASSAASGYAVDSYSDSITGYGNKNFAIMWGMQLLGELTNAQPQVLSSTGGASFGIFVSPFPPLSPVVMVQCIHNQKTGQKSLEINGQPIPDIIAASNILTLLFIFDYDNSELRVYDNNTSILLYTLSGNLPGTGLTIGNGNAFDIMVSTDSPFSYSYSDTFSITNNIIYSPQMLRALAGSLLPAGYFNIQGLPVPN